ncbi:MAG: hypothetical protein M3509_08850, partial [Chloroflexota bacterium]|nr:hypothetical protein [Chloroflexota bacterium]
MRFSSPEFGFEPKRRFKAAVRQPDAAVVMHIGCHRATAGEAARWHRRVAATTGRLDPRHQGST